MQGQGRLQSDARALLGAGSAVEVAQGGPERDAAYQSVESLLHELHVHQIELEMQNETLRQSQTALEISRDHYLEFFDFAPVGYLTLNDKGLIVEVNLTGAAMLGTDRAMLLQRGLSRCIAPEDRDRWRRHLVRALQADVKQNCEVALLRPDATRLEVRVDSLLLARPGKAQRLRLVLTDISKRKHAEQALADSEQRFSLFMDTLPAAAFIKDEDSTIVYANRYSAENIGARSGLGKSNQEIFPPELAEKMVADDRRAMETGYLVTEEQLPTRNGELRFYETHKFRISRQGQPPLLGGIAIDISERKRVEEQLRAMTANLEAKVDERTKELRRLAAQLTFTEERERRLLAQDLHDNLGQLLAVIKIKLTSLVVGSLDSSIHQLVELVDQAEWSARAITMELSPPILRTLGMVPALEWLTDEMERIYGLRVHFDHENEGTTVAGEIQTVVYRFVRELLINVAKHSHVSEADLYCHCDGKHLTVAVSDYGCGFDQAALRDGVAGNHGFGLSSVYERVTNIGGEIEIDSSPGNGTTVTLTVPCSIAAKGEQS